MARGTTWWGVYFIVGDPRAWLSCFSALKTAREEEEGRHWEGTRRWRTQQGHRRLQSGGSFPLPPCIFETPALDPLNPVCWEKATFFGSILRNYFVHHKLIHDNLIQQQCNPTALNRVMPRIALAHQWNCCELSGLRNQVNWWFTVQQRLFYKEVFKT